MSERAGVFLRTVEASVTGAVHRPRVARRERDVLERDLLERAIRSTAERASQASAVVDDAHDAGLDGSHIVTLPAKMLRLEFLNMKADLAFRSARPSPHRLRQRVH